MSIGLKLAIYIGVCILAVGVKLALAMIPADIAYAKGYNYHLFFAFGIFFILAAIIVSLFLEDKDKTNIYHTDPVYEIMKYKELLDSGAITKEEYEEKKKYFLNIKQ